MKVSDPSLLGSAFANNGKDEIRIKHLLAHSAGFPPDPIPNYCMSPLYSPLYPYKITIYCLGEKAFGCPETSKPQPAEKVHVPTADLPITYDSKSSLSYGHKANL
jgi:CubicO group peptidase (beta-lactamase class C family)